MDEKWKSAMVKRVLLFTVVFLIAFFGTRYLVKKFKNQSNQEPAATESSR